MDNGGYVQRLTVFNRMPKLVSAQSQIMHLLASGCNIRFYMCGFERMLHITEFLTRTFPQPFMNVWTSCVRGI